MHPATVTQDKLAQMAARSAGNQWAGVTVGSNLPSDPKIL